MYFINVVNTCLQDINKMVAIAKDGGSAPEPPRSFRPRAPRGSAPEPPCRQMQTFFIFPLAGEEKLW